MTLNVSLRVPDGIVLASDSLATLMQRIDQKMNVTVTCPGCGNRFEQKDIQTPPMSVPSSTWPYAQKMFPLQRRLGLATYGSGFVNSRSIYNHIIELTPRFPHADDNTAGLEEMAQFIVEYFTNQLRIECQKASIDINLQPDNWWPFGFQLVGFTKDANGDPVPGTYLLRIGKNSHSQRYDSIGCTWSGDGSVVALLWPKSGTGAANFAAFSLQDAIDYAKFLIKTTADFQRFSGRLPTVGGEIDIALITNHRGFRWIAQKELYRILDREDQ
jgi:hypothetical protein